MSDNTDMENSNVLLKSNKDSSENFTDDSSSRRAKDPCRCEMCRVKR